MTSGTKWEKQLTVDWRWLTDEKFLGIKYIKSCASSTYNKWDTAEELMRAVWGIVYRLKRMGPRTSLLFLGGLVQLRYGPFSQLTSKPRKKFHNLNLFFNRITLQMWHILIMYFFAQNRPASFQCIFLRNWQLEMKTWHTKFLCRVTYCKENHSNMSELL